jgi:2-methylcitrate dehydratase PrpD
MSTAHELATWASALEPSEDDLQLAERSLKDTLAVALAARKHPLVSISSRMGEAGHWAAVGHVLDFDDLHMESTTHISTVIVPTVLSTGGDARAYLAGAGVMARLGTALGWSHYASGWHATCTAGAPAAAVAAGIAMGLTVEELAHAIALSVPAAGGNQRAFGTMGKALQVGFAADAGVRAAELAQAGARSDLDVVDSWLVLVGARSAVKLEGPAIPGGLAIKLFPCCYAMQRPIGAMRMLRGVVDATDVLRITATTPAGTVHPLIHQRPTTGLEGKFSLEYSLATALLDDFPAFESFTDDAVRRPLAQDLVRRVTTDLPVTDDDNLLAGTFELTIATRSGRMLSSAIDMPPGSPAIPPTAGELAAKIRSCGDGVADLLVAITWATAADLLRDQLPVARLQAAGRA